MAIPALSCYLGAQPLVTSQLSHRIISLIIFQYLTPCQPFTATADDPSMIELVAAAATIRVDDRLTSRVDSHSLMAVWQQPGSLCLRHIESTSTLSQL